MLEKTLEKGLIHIYTGDGKGKTTAAIGQGTRTAGGGYRVLMVQFLKGDDTGELYSIEAMPNFTIKRYAEINSFYPFLPEEKKELVKEDIKRGLREIAALIEGQEYNMIIMDEIMGVLYNEIITVEEVLQLLIKRPSNMEVILTGRNAPEELVRIADYVTEMKMIKHPYEKGINARKGIES